MNVPLRYSIPLDDINGINVSIEAYSKAISFYEEWVVENGEWEYVEERILYLTNILCEYMIAASFAQEGAVACGVGSGLYESVKKDFQKKHPNREFPTQRELQ
jgi:hypothetical protein